MKLRSLSVTLAVTFLFFSMGILLIASGLQIYFSFQAQRKAIVIHQELIAQNAANKVREFILGKFVTLENAVVLTNLATAAREEQKLTMERLLGREPSFRQARLLNRQGKELARTYRLSRAESERLTNRIDAELLSRIERANRYFSSVYVDEITGEPMAVMAVPVSDVFGDFKGALISEVNLKFMWDLVDGIKIGEKGLAYVVDSLGNLIAFSDITRVLKRENLGHLAEVKRILNPDDAPVEEVAHISKGILDGYVVASHAILSEPGWAVVVESPVLEVYESVIWMIKLFAGVLLFSFIMAFFSGVYLSKRITRPVIELRDATRKVSKGDLGAAINIESRNEIGELAASFNQMVTDLHNTTVSIEELEKEQKRFHDIAASTGEWIWEVDANGRYTYSNPVVEGILGYKPEEIIGKCFYEFFHCDERDKLLKAASLVFSRREIFEHFLNANVHKNGQTVILETSGVPVLSPEGELMGYRGVDRDITERVKAEEEKEKLQSQLLQSTKMTAIGTLTGGIAHDFNNILTAILGSAQLLETKLSNKTDFYNLIEGIETSAHRGAELTNKLLSFSRRTKMVLQTLNLNSIIDEVSDLLKRTVEKMISIELHLAPDLWEVEADPTQIYQVILNICINAKESMMPMGKGKMIIKTECQELSKNDMMNYAEGQPGRFVVLSVSDTGVGMDKDFVKRIFEPFFTTKEMGKGVGLGLAVSYGIIKEHNGFIKVYSEKGKGSCFKIYLPASASTAKPEIKTVPKGKEIPQVGQGTILFVDDEQLIRDTGKSVLEEFGFRVFLAKDGMEAASIYQNKKDMIDMVILDLIMPGWSGKETLKALRQINPEVKALISSGYSIEGTTEEVTRMGVSGFIRKPYLIKELLEAVKKILAPDQ